MRTYKYPIRKHPKNKRLGHLLDDMHEVHKYFHLWQRQRYKDGLPYANYHAMSAHLTELKKTTHPHWNVLPSQAIQCKLKRIDAAYKRFFNKIKVSFLVRKKVLIIGGVRSGNWRYCIGKSAGNALTGTGNLPPTSVDALIRLLLKR